jgi:hypothetical protein
MNNFIQLINVKGDFFNSFVFQVRAHITFFYYKILILFHRFSYKRGIRRRRCRPLCLPHYIRLILL